MAKEKLRICIKCGHQECPSCKHTGRRDFGWCDRTKSGLLDCVAMANVPIGHLRKHAFQPKVSASVVDEIRRRYGYAGKWRRGGEKLISLALEFGLSESYVSRLVANQRRRTNEATHLRCMRN